MIVSLVHCTKWKAKVRVNGTAIAGRLLAGDMSILCASGLNVADRCGKLAISTYV